MMLNGGFELLDILGTALPERGLGLSITLFPLLGCCIYLDLRFSNQNSSAARMIFDLPVSARPSFSAPGHVLV